MENQPSDQQNPQPQTPPLQTVPMAPVQAQVTPVQNQSVQPQVQAQPIQPQGQPVTMAQVQQAPLVQPQPVVQPQMQPQPQVTPLQSQQIPAAQPQPVQTQARIQTQGQGIVYQQTNARPPVQQRPNTPGIARKPPNPKKLLVGCGGCAGLLLFFFIAFVLIFVMQTNSVGENPLARQLGLNTANFIGTLILLVNLIFGAIAITLFLVAIIGIFRFFMARKDDRLGRRKGLTQAGISFLLLFIISFLWIGIYLFLSSKKPTVERGAAVGILTEPANTLGLTAPVTIKFDASSAPISHTKYDIISYSWDFGDGQTSTVESPSHLFKENGRFDVTVKITKRDKATKQEGTDPFTTTVVIANVELGAIFTATPMQGPAPLEVSFDASASKAPAGEITTYEWDFDNNNNFNDAQGAVVKHTFEQNGTYKVNLRVTDNTGQFKVTTQEITVAAEALPEAIIEVPTQDGKYYSGQQYSFQAGKSSSPNGDIQKYEWDFGDDSAKANTRTATHSYKTTGTYTVTLKVTDKTEKTGQSTLNLTVEKSATAPIAAMTTVPAPEKDQSFIHGPIPFEVAFDGSKSQDADNNIVDYQWDFDGDGTVDAAGETANYVYKTEGIYNATLTVTDSDNNESKAIIIVKVETQPLKAQLAAAPLDGNIALTVSFDATASTYPGSQISAYEWDFGDGTPKRIDAAKITYKYTKIGTFTASVTAIAEDNTRSTASVTINVRPVALGACFEAIPLSGPAPLTVDFDPRCTTGTAIKYSWDFGDGQSTKTRKPSHTFTIPGSYQVTLEVADNQNVINTYTKNVLVTGELKQ